MAGCLVKQRDVSCHIEQATPLELPLNFHQHITNLAQQAERDGNIIDAGVGFAVAFETAAQDQHIVGGNASLIKTGICRVVPGEGETCCNLCLIGVIADQRKIGPAAKCQPKCVQQYRFACTSLAGQHGQPGTELQGHLFNKDNVGNSEAMQHR